MDTRIAIASCLLAGSALAADFWIQKKPAEWNDKEAKRLLTKSPWAKEVTLAMGGGPGGGGRGGGGGGRRGGGGGGMGGGGMGGGGGRGGGGGGIGGDDAGGGGGIGGGGMGGGDMGGGGGMPSGPRVTVVWDSAEPVHEAREKLEKKDYAKEKAGEYYIVSIVGMPLRPQQDPQFKQRLLKATSLARKGKDPILAENVGFIPGDKGLATLVYLFPRKDVLQDTDKEVTFQSHMGPMEVKVKFSFKEMIYGGKLSL